MVFVAVAVILVVVALIVTTGPKKNCYLFFLWV